VVRDTLMMNTHALVRAAPVSANADMWCESQTLGQAGRLHSTLHVDKQLVVKWATTCIVPLTRSPEPMSHSEDTRAPAAHITRVSYRT
jgi:hypothetical protein